MKNLIKAVVLSLVLVAVAACGNDTADEGRQVLTMGTSADYKPFQFIDLENDNAIIGFDVDLATHIASELGYELEIVDMDFNTLITSLRAGRVDMVLAGMSPTPERKEVVDFSDVYHKSQVVLLTTEDQDIASVEDLTGMTLGVQTGSIQEELVTGLMEDGLNVTATGMDRLPELVQQLLAGRVDAVVMEDMVTPIYLEHHDHLTVANVFENDSLGSAIALPRDSKLTAQINEILAEMVEDGTMEALVAKWFN